MISGAAAQSLRRRVSGLLALALGLSCLQAPAADRALLVGVGDYNIPGAVLPGIEHDLDTMRELVGQFGFDRQSIKVLTGRAATLAGIRIAFQRHLIHGVKADDRVLFYFSGHGTQVPDLNGDEADGADETLMPYDARLVRTATGTRLGNVLIDDELETLLHAIPARDVLVIVDACHSGTVTRFGPDPDKPAGPALVPKTFTYEGMPEVMSLRAFESTDATPEPATYIGLSAAADDEIAIATDEGSIFTTALARVLVDEAGNMQDVMLSEVAVKVARHIEGQLDPTQTFTPQLNGNVEAANGFALPSLRAQR